MTTLKKINAYFNRFIGSCCDLVDEENRKLIIERWQSAECILVESLKKKTKTAVDSEKPKGAKSAYILFCKELRPAITLSNPDLPPTKILTKLGEMWKALPENKKKKYNDLAAKDKERKEAEMQVYYTKYPEKRPEPKPSKSVKPKDDKPKSDYNIFCEIERPKIRNENPELSSKNIQKILSEKWAINKDKRKEDAKKKKEKVLYNYVYDVYKEISSEREDVTFNDLFTDLRERNCKISKKKCKDIVRHILRQEEHENQSDPEEDENFIPDSSDESDESNE